MTQGKTHREPLLRIAKREDIPRWKAWLIRLIAVVLALAVEDTVQTRGEQAAGIMDLTQEEYDAAFTPASG